jgi:hypothetical protein
MPIFVSRHKITGIFLFFFFLFLNSCGRNTKENEYAVFANPGPKSCLAYSLSSFAQDEKYAPPVEPAVYLNGHPHQVKLHSDPFDGLNFNLIFGSQHSRANSGFPVGIYGGQTTTAANQTCGAATDGGVAKIESRSFMPFTNTVGLIVPNSWNDGYGEQCSGAIVATNATGTLIVTAAHCFDNQTDFSDITANNAVVRTSAYFSNTSTGVYSVACWQRSPYYHKIPANDVSSALYDVAWVLVATTTMSSDRRATIYTGTVSAGEEKVMAGVGITETSESGTLKCVSTNVDAAYPTRGDVLPADGAAMGTSVFNTQAYKMLGNRISGFPSDPFNSMLMVIGPLNRSASPYGYGSCNGDSGGPVYRYSTTNKWVLVGLTQGSNKLLSPQPSVYFFGLGSSASLRDKFYSGNYADCSDGYGVYTRLSYHVPWIQSSSGFTLSTASN